VEKRGGKGAYLDTALELFGPESLIGCLVVIGPLRLVAGQYEQVLEIIELFIQPLSPSEKLNMGGNGDGFLWNKVLKNREMAAKEIWKL